MRYIVIGAMGLLNGCATMPNIPNVSPIQSYATMNCVQLQQELTLVQQREAGLRSYAGQQGQSLFDVLLEVGLGAMAADGKMSTYEMQQTMYDKKDVDRAYANQYHTEADIMLQRAGALQRIMQKKCR